MTELVLALLVFAGIPLACFALMNVRYRIVLARDALGEPRTRWGWVLAWSCSFVFAVSLASYGGWWLLPSPVIVWLAFLVLEASSRRRAWIALPVGLANLVLALAIHSRVHYPTDAERAEMRAARARAHAHTARLLDACEADAQGPGCHDLFKSRPFRLPSRYRTRLD